MLTNAFPQRKSNPLYHMADLAPGDRVIDRSENAGTVRYVGPVATSKTASTVYVGACGARVRPRPRSLKRAAVRQASSGTIRRAGCTTAQ